MHHTRCAKQRHTLSVLDATRYKAYQHPHMFLPFIIPALLFCTYFVTLTISVAFLFFFHFHCRQSFSFHAQTAQILQFSNLTACFSANACLTVSLTVFLNLIQIRLHSFIFVPGVSGKTAPNQRNLLEIFRAICYNTMIPRKNIKSGGVAACQAKNGLGSSSASPFKWMCSDTSCTCYFA